MITVYFHGFATKSFKAYKADITSVGNRQILSLISISDNVVAQFDMDNVIGWVDDDYEETEEE